MPITKVLFLAQGFREGEKNGSSRKITELLSRVSPQFADAKGFLSASVKWRPKGKFLVNKSQAPAVLGENAPQLRVKGEPSLAESIAKSAEASGLWAEATEEWGLDPGHWRPLQLLKSGDVTAIPLSLSQMSPEAHRKWGIAVKRAAQKYADPLTLVVSGSLSFRPDLGDLADSQVEAFDQELIRILTKGPLVGLEDVNRNLFKAAQPEGGWGSIYFLWGAVGDKTVGNLEMYERPLPGVAQAAITFSLS